MRVECPGDMTAMRVEKSASEWRPPCEWIALRARPPCEWIHPPLEWCDTKVVRLVAATFGCAGVRSPPQPGHNEATNGVLVARARRRVL